MIVHEGSARRPRWGRRSDGVRRATVVALTAGALLGVVAPGPAAAELTARSIASACEGAPAAGFEDIGGADAGAVSCIAADAWAGITRGATATRYQPAAPVRRDQMASFLARVLTAFGVPRPSSVPDAFDDDDGNVHEGSIDWLAEVGLVHGVGDRRYAPATTVNRAQMASFLTRLLADLDLEPAAGDPFPADDCGPHEGAVRFLGTHGIAVGRGTVGAYDCASAVTRGQMAHYLSRTLAVYVEETGAPNPFVRHENHRYHVRALTDESRAVGGERTYVVWGVDRATVDLVLLPCTAVEVGPDLIVRFVEGRPETADLTPARTAHVAAIDGRATDGVARYHDNVPVSGGDLTFTVSGDEAGCVRPVVYEDGNDDDDMHLEPDGQPGRTDFGVGGAVSFRN